MAYTSSYLSPGQKWYSIVLANHAYRSMLVAPPPIQGDPLHAALYHIPGYNPQGPAVSSRTRCDALLSLNRWAPYRYTSHTISICWVPYPEE